MFFIWSDIFFSIFICWRNWRLQATCNLQYLRLKILSWSNRRTGRFCSTQNDGHTKHALIHIFPHTVRDISQELRIVQRFRQCPLEKLQYAHRRSVLRSVFTATPRDRGVPLRSC